MPIGRLRSSPKKGASPPTWWSTPNEPEGQAGRQYAQLPVTVVRHSRACRTPSASGSANSTNRPVSSKKIAEALTWLSENLDTVMKWLGRIAEVGLAVLVYRLIPALIIAWQTAGAAAVTAASTTAAAWATANLSVSNAIATVGKLRVAFGVRRSHHRLGDWDVAVGEVRDRPQGGHLHQSRC